MGKYLDSYQQETELIHMRMAFIRYCYKCVLNSLSNLIIGTCRMPLLTSYEFSGTNDFKLVWGGINT